MFDFLEDNKLLIDDINYQNCDENYIKIIKFINENKKDYIKGIQQKEEKGMMRFEESENIIEIKTIINEPNSEYIDNFVLIDEEYYTFLYKTFGGNLYMFHTMYSYIKDKLFLIINFLNKNIYEIVSFNKNDFIVEYSIEISNKVPEYTSYNKDTEKLNNKIFQILNENEISKIISEKGITVDNNLVMRFHSINRNNALRDSIEKTPKLLKEEKGIIPINNSKANQTLFLPPVIPGINRNQYIPPPSQTVMIQKNQNIILTQFPVQPKMNKGFENNKNANISYQPYFLVDEGLASLSQNLYPNDNLVFYQGQLLHNATSLGKITNLVPYNIKFEQIQFNKKVFSFPKNFMIINQSYLDTNLALIRNKLNNKLIEKIDCFQKERIIIFKTKEINHPKLTKDLIYIYLKKSKGSIGSKEPFAIIECKDTLDQNIIFKKLEQHPNLHNIINNPN